MKKILYLLIGAGILLACSDTNKTALESKALSQCLAAKDYRYEMLLTKADIAKYVNINEASFKKEISSTKGKYGSCTYSWESGCPKWKR
ncbi:hypothetical protein [Xanthomarina gelatinilytica]|uniref:hypothetical protein n=1 Tax=Xanthomarina gelatinilytica TaxID=1137281 RepID=UPI003AA96CAC